jgi:hypothetical protein
MDAKNSLIEQYELVKDIHYVFENVEPKIKFRIYKIIIGANAKYTWDINYYCRLEDEIESYTPSAPFAESIESIEQMLNQNAKRFESAVNWRINNYF